MKKIFLTVFILLFFVGKLWALEAQVIVLQTPMFKEADVNSKILFYLRKGKIIKLHDKHKGVGPNDIDYGISTNDEHPLFYAMISSTGNDVFVLREHVKVIYKDFREMDFSISPYENDPTDYRLVEPLLENYPLIGPRAHRVLYALGMGPSTKNRYPYATYMVKENYDATFRGQISYGRQVELLESSRMMFGGVLSSSYKSRDFLFEDGKKTYERTIALGIGPYTSYDGFRNENYALIFGAGVSINTEFLYISLLKEGEKKSTGRSFIGYYFTPQISASFIKKLKSIHAGFDFVVKSEMGLETSHQLAPLVPLKSDDEIWNSSYDAIDEGLSGNLTIYVGFQYTMI